MPNDAKTGFPPRPETPAEGATGRPAVPVPAEASPRLRVGASGEEPTTGLTTRIADTGSFAVTGSLVLGRVLIVEDEALVAMDVQWTLQREGFEVVGIADTQATALEMATSQPVDLILMDIHLRGGDDGVETAQAILAERSIPVVFLTAYADEVSVRRAMELSPDGYLLKPVDERTLLATCVAALRRHRNSQLARWMKQAIDSSTEAMVVLDRFAEPAVPRMANAAFHRTFGDVHDLDGEALVKRILPDGDRVRVRRLRDAVRQGLEARDQGMCLPRTGDAFSAAVSVRPILEREGACRYVLLVVTDLTRDLGHEEALLLRGALPPLTSAMRQLLSTLEDRVGARRQPVGEEMDAALLTRLREATGRLDEVFALLQSPVHLSEATCEVRAHLLRRRGTLEAWLGAPLDLVLPEARSGWTTPLSSEVLDRVLLGVCTTLGGGDGHALEAVPASSGSDRLELRFTRQAPPLDSALLRRSAVTMRPPATGERLPSTLDDSGLRAARAIVGRAGGTLEFIREGGTASAPMVVLGLPLVASAAPGPPRRSTAEILLFPNVRAHCVVALADGDARRRMSAALREAFFQVTAVAEAPALREVIRQRAEAFDLLFIGEDLLHRVEEETPGFLGAEIPGTSLIVVGRPGQMQGDATLPPHRFLTWPASEESCVRLAIDTLERSVPVRPTASTDGDATEEDAAKTGGPSRVQDPVLSDQELIDRARGRDAELLDVFLEALRGLQVHYQPLVRSADASVFAYEALMRPSHAVLRHPGLMLDAAERLGLLGLLGRAVRRRVAEDCHALPFKDVQIFVNLHPTELTRELCALEEPLRSLANRVVFEITERAYLSGIPELEETLAALRAQGFRFAVDDLGEGYSGLVSLQRLRPEVVKIDMSLVREIHKSPFKRDLLKTLQVFFRAQRYETVAEGVESREEADTLSGLGIMLLQGYLFAKPGPPWPDV